MTTFGILAIAGITAFLITWFTVDYSIFGFSLLLLASLLTELFGVEHGLVGSVHFGLGDAVAGMLMFAGVLRFMSRRIPLNISSLLLITYVSLIFVSLARGIAVFGLRNAANEARTFFDIAACLLYFSSFHPTPGRIEKYFYVYLIYAVSLIFVACARLVGILPPILNDPARRPLPAMGAYSLCLAFLICLCWDFYGNAPRYCRWLTPVFASAAIALRHRTVWIVMLGVVVVLYKLERRILRKFMPVIIAVGILTIAIGSFVYGSRLEQEFYSSGTNSSTLLWRVQGWMDLIHSTGQTPVTYVLGQPFGTGYTRYIDGAVVNAGAHNDYLAEFLRVGLIGLIAFLLLLLRPTYLLFRNRKDLNGIYPHSLFWVLFTVSILLWNLTYDLTPDQSAFIGMLTSIMFCLSGPSEVVVSPIQESPIPLFMQAKDPKAI